MTTEERKAQRAALNHANYLRRKGKTEARPYRGWRTCRECGDRKPVDAFPSDKPWRPCQTCMETRDQKRSTKQAAEVLATVTERLYALSILLGKAGLADDEHAVLDLRAHLISRYHNVAHGVSR